VIVLLVAMVLFGLGVPFALAAYFLTCECYLAAAIWAAVFVVAAVGFAVKGREALRLRARGRP
jgi:hypothetical protein